MSERYFFIRATEIDDPKLLKMLMGEPPSAPPPPPTSVLAMPAGVPAPDFGLAETAPPFPSPWDGKVDGFFCVDQYSANATDAENLNGFPGRPRKTMPRGLPPGSVVQVRGVYDYAPQGYETITGTGTDDRPIFVVGASSGIRRHWYTRGAYMIFEGLYFISHGGNREKCWSTSGDAHHVALRHCDISGNAIAGGVSVGEGAHHVVISDCEIHHNGDHEASHDQDVHGVAIGRASYVWVLGCEITRNSGDGVQINAGSLAAQAQTHHIYVGRNVAHHNKQSGFWVKQAVDVVVSENLSHDHRPSGSDPGAGMGFQYAPERVWYLFNEIRDCDIGIYGGSDSGLGTGVHVYVVGNAIHHVHQRSGTWSPDSAWSKAAILLAGGGNLRLVANHLRDVDAGLHVPVAGRCTLEGNVIDAPTRGGHVWIERADTAAASTYRDNLVTPGPGILRLGRSAPQVATEVAGFGTAGDDPRRAAFSGSAVRRIFVGTYGRELDWPG
jgi:hypothetical protein